MSSQLLLTDRLAQLSPNAQRIALIYGIVYPLAPSQTRVIQWLNQTPALVTPKSLAIAMRDTIAELVEAGVLEPPQTGGGYRANKEFSATLIRHAHSLGYLAPLLKVLNRDAFIMDWGQAQGTSEMYLRCALLSGDYEWMHKVRTRLQWSVLLEPQFQSAIGSMPPAYQEVAVFRCVEEVLNHLRPMDDFLDACERSGQPSASTCANIAWIRVLQGRFDGALTWLASMPEGNDYQVVRASTIALIHTLKGEDDAAVRSIQAALTAERAGSRKRIMFPQYSAFALSLLALVRRNTRETSALFDELQEHLEKLHILNFASPLIRIAQRIRKEPKVKFTAASAVLGDVQLLLHGLVLCWTEATALPGNRPLLQQFPAMIERARDAGFFWLAAEAAQILEAASGVKGRHGAHSALGTQSLISAIPVIEVWEHGLNALEELALNLRDKKAKVAPTREVERRLAWIISDSHFDRLTVEAREQQLKKSGWTKGRPVSLKKLKETGGSLDWLSEQDKSVADGISITTYGWRDQKEYYLPDKSILALAGHPAVFDTNGQSLAIVATEPELVIDERENGTLNATLTPYPDSDAAYQVNYRLGDTSVTVMHLNNSVKALCQIIPPRGLSLPSSARSRLLEVVSELAGEIRVHGGLSGTTASALQVEADSLPWVQLTPAGDGLSIRLLVQPITDAGMQFDPGGGGELVIAHVADQPLQARRDLKAEKLAAIALLEQCPQLAAAGAPRFRGELETADDCLELLDQLHGAGARCLWPSGEKYKLVARSGSSAMHLVIKSGKEWFSASGELKIDEDRTLGLMRLMALLDERPRSRFLPLGDGEFVALTDSFRKQLETLRGVSHGGTKGLRLHPLAAPALENMLDDINIESDDAWQQQLQRLQDARQYTPAIPATLQAELRPYQQDGIHWLARLAHWGVGACLADDMGLGKTLQTLGLLLIRAPEGPAVVVVPTSLVDNWVTEARRFAPTLNVLIYAGSPGERQSMLRTLGAFDLLLVTYGLLQNDIESISATHFHSAVIDEAQAIKNAATKRAQAVRALDAGFRLATTGTPVQNNLMDLFSLFSFLNPGLLGSAAQFREVHALPIERDNDPDARLRLARLIQPFVLRRTKTEVLDDLPSRTEITRSVTLGPDETVFYEALRRQAVAALEGLGEISDGQRQFQVLAHLTRLRLACCHPRLVQDTGIRDSAKLTEFMELLEELLLNRHKVLVFSQFVKHLKLIEERLVSADISYQYLDGQTPRQQRSERINAFQAGTGDVFLISLKAGGTGLNLTAADYVIHMDPWWNPAAEDQASDRAHRIGQTRPVTIYRLVARGTIEEQIVALHHRKRDLAQQLLEGTDTSARLDADELLSLLREPLTRGFV